MTQPRQLRAGLLHLLSDRGPKLLRDLVSLAGGQMSSMVIGFLAFAYLARILDPASYGAVEYAISLVAIFAIVIEGGLGPIGVREIARDRGRAPELAAQILGTRLLLALLVVPLVGLTGFLTAGDAGGAQLVWLFALGLFAMPCKQDWLLQGLERMGLAAAAQPVRMAAFALGVFLLVRSSEDLLSVGYLEIAAAAVGAGYYLLVQQIWAVPVGLRLSLRAGWQLLRQGIPVSLSTIGWAFMQYAPIYLVAWLVGGAETAWLGSSQRIVLSLLTFSFVYYFNLYPVIARHLGDDRDEWQRLMQASMRLMAWGAIGLALLLTLASPTIMTLTFGEKFAAAAPVFAILIWALPIRMISGHARWTLIGAGLQRYLLLSEIIGVCFLMVAGLVLIAPFGAVGAAAAAVVGNLVAWIAAHLFVVRRVGRLPSLWGPLAPAGVALAAGLLAWLALPNALAAAAAALAAYLFCAAVIGGGLKADLKRLAYAKADLVAE